MTFAGRAPGGKVRFMLWKLRLLWYRADKAALAFAVFFASLVGSLVFAFTLVSGHRDAQAAACATSTRAAWIAWRATSITRRAASPRPASTRWRKSP